MIKFNYNKEKAIHCVLWFLNKHGGSISKLKLVKLLFFAEEKHLFKYGRPIIGGHWCALQWGPVPSEFLDDLNNKDLFEEKDHKITFANKTKIEFDEECFSESDLEVLEEINNFYGRKDSFVLSNESHELESYQKNKPDNSNKNKLISYEDFFLDTNNNSMLGVIKDSQEAFSVFE